MKVVFCSSEVFPFAKSGGLGDVCGSLPLALSKIGIEVAIVMPGYGCVGKSGYPMEQVTETVSRTKLGDNIQVHFIEHEDYFGRDGLYGYASGDYPDNIDRFGFYCDQVLRLLKQIDFQPDVIHCHDWQTALIPVYIKEKYGEDAFYARTKTIMTIHNLAFQGVFPRVQYPKLDVEGSFAAQSFEFYDQIIL